MSYKEIFEKHAKSFAQVLSGLGYEFTESSDSSGDLAVEYYTDKYFNKKTGLEIFLGFTTWDSGNSSMDLCMFKETDRRYCFFLNHFINNHHLEHKINWKCPAGNDVDNFLAKFFRDLEVLVNNELHDQFTGKSFEDHSKISEESWLRHKSNRREGDPEVVYDTTPEEVAQEIIKVLKDLKLGKWKEDK